MSPSSNTITVPPNAQAGTNLGGVTLGGPIAEKIDPLRDLGIRRPGTGFAGVYLPNSVFSAFTVHVMPAIEITASDDSFIGFDATATIGFANPSASIDTANGGILVSIDFTPSITATCRMNIGCGISLPIGEAIIQPAPGSQASFQMGFYPTVDTSGTLKFTAVLRNIDVGTYVAIVVGVGTALEILGITAFIGFLVNTVLSAILSFEFPSALRDAIKKYLGQNEWTLLQLDEALAKAGNVPTGLQYDAPFSVDTGSFPDSLLASVGNP